MLIHTRCPLDGPEEADEELYAANFAVTEATPEIFGARRTPDRIHYRMVRNTQSGCVRADPILDEETIVSLYRESTLDDMRTAELAADTYRHYLGRALPFLPDFRGALEIGCGHGAFLERLTALDFERVQGLELSADAIECAKGAIRPSIVRSALRDALFEPESFSLVCGFQVLDHLVEPNRCLSICREALVSQGVMYWICHDLSSIFARVLGRRCPIIDIQHVVLYDRKSVAALFEKAGFEVLAQFGVSNSYPVSYWGRFAPVPGVFKRPLIKLLRSSGIGSVRLRANFGNMGIIARKCE